jgi:hypothetical protein
MTRKTTAFASKNTVGKQVKKVGRTVAASSLTQRTQSKSLTLDPVSGKVISRTMTTHRDALKRLADR